METVIRICAPVFLGLLAMGCVGGLDFDGKACSSDHPCPGGYTCDRGVCRAIGADAGPDGSDAGPDGADDGPGRCENDLPCTLDDTSCDLSTGECVPAGLCTRESCAQGECAGGACVIVPQREARTTAGSADLACHQSALLPPPGELSTCAITGQAIDVQNQEGAAKGINDLDVRLRLLSDVLDGVLTEVEDQDTTRRDSFKDGVFRLEVPTNEDLVIELSGREDYAHTFVFGLYQRDDECADSASFAIPVLSQQLVEDELGSAGGLLERRGGTGLVVGFVQDCQGIAMLGATGGLSHPHDLLFYPSDSGTADCTQISGIFCAANVTPIRGVVSALALNEDGSVCVLGMHALRVFPGRVSELVFSRPVKAE